MSALEPGLYRATVCGTPDTIVTVKPGVYATTYAVGRYNEDQHRDITDARPLIVLDLSVGRPATALVAHLREGYWDGIADQIEAQTKPARIPEPGLWGVVEADGYRWMRFQNTEGECWCNAFGEARAWDDFTDDPTLIRPGVAS